MSNIGILARLHDGNNIKAYSREHPAAISEIHLGRLANPDLFDWGHAFDGRPAGERTTQFDLNKDQGCAVQGDEVHFTPSAAEVALEDMVAAFGQVIGGSAFPFVAQSRGNVGLGPVHLQRRAIEQKVERGLQNGRKRTPVDGARPVLGQRSEMFVGRVALVLREPILRVEPIVLIHP